VPCSLGTMKLLKAPNSCISSSRIRIARLEGNHKLYVQRVPAINPRRVTKTPRPMATWSKSGLVVPMQKTMKEAKVDPVTIAAWDAWPIPSWNTNERMRKIIVAKEMI